MSHTNELKNGTFKPTHFIGQYSVKVKRVGKPEIFTKQYFTACMEIEYLPFQLMVVEKPGMKTVAVFKIMMKHRPTKTIHP